MNTNPMLRPPTNHATIDALQDCLRGELAATETYQLALERVTHIGVHRVLQEIFASHARRATRLQQRLEQFGAELPRTLGVWGAFAKVIQRGADMLGDKAAVAALEEGEDHQNLLYATLTRVGDQETRRYVEVEFVPEQTRTHEMCRDLKQYVRAPS